MRVDPRWLVPVVVLAGACQDVPTSPTDIAVATADPSTSFLRVPEPLLAAAAMRDAAARLAPSLDEGRADGSAPLGPALDGLALQLETRGGLTRASLAAATRLLADRTSGDAANSPEAAGITLVLAGVAGVAGEGR